jgi:hypothetical protein
MTKDFISKKPHLVTTDGKPIPLQTGHVLMFDQEGRLRVFSQMPQSDNPDQRYQLLPRGFRTQSEGFLLHALQTLGLAVNDDIRRQVITVCFQLLYLQKREIDLQTVGAEPIEKPYFIRVGEVSDLPKTYLKINKVNGELTGYEVNPLDAEAEGPQPDYMLVYTPFADVPITPDQLTMWVNQVWDILMLTGVNKVTCISDSPTEIYFAVG